MTEQLSIPGIAGPTFEMTVDLNVLDHLGINLYSNIAWLQDHHRRSTHRRGELTWTA